MTTTWFGTMSADPLECELWLLALCWRAGHAFGWWLFDARVEELARCRKIRARA